MEISSPLPFGEVLKTYRKLHGLTQQQLAQKLDIHQNTVGAWERGHYLPATRGMILEIGRCLRLSQTEVRHLLEAGLLTKASRWNVPYQLNPFFTGRQAVLQQIHTFLSAESRVAARRSCVLSGLAGIGKTQTAIEYAYRHAPDYAAVFWINAQTEVDLLESFATIARTLDLPLHPAQTQAEEVEMVLDWLYTHRDWLLILDNVEQRELVQRFLPASATGSFLLTTRLPSLGTLAPCLELQPLPLEESMQFLFRRTGVLPLHRPSAPIAAQESAAARAIVTPIDGLPLALDLAAAYIEEAQCSFAGFLSLVQYDTRQVLQVHPASATYPYSVEKTFTLAFAQLQRKNKIAADLLTVCCFLAPGEIPEALLLKGASHLTTELQDMLADPLRRQATFKDLHTSALLRQDTQAQTLSIHPLVQIVLKEQLPEALQRMWIERLITLLDQLFLVEPDRLDTQQWAWCEQILPHVQCVLQIAARFQFIFRKRASLLQKTTTYLYQRAHTRSRQNHFIAAPSLSHKNSVW